MKKQPTTHEIDALVLAGGESRRVGSPKALLPLGGTTLIGTIIGFSLRIDRLWDRFAKGKRSAEERPTAP